ncbi:MAG: V-type ATP synthase subunit I [Peptococcaceae bacterium]|jgi:V/A-type H+-transporting ATPase subunit I|nr:V-type ATP synthase subunit I [Peptococcaceae bacterium]
MAIVEMRNISLIAMQEDKKGVLDTLMRLGVVEISELDEELIREEFQNSVRFQRDDEGVARLDAVAADLRLSIDLLRKAGAKSRGMLAGRPEYTSREFKGLVDKYDECMQVCGQIKKKDSRVNQIRAEETALDNKIASLTPWIGLDVPLTDIRPYQKFTAVMGTIPAAADEVKFRQGLRERAERCYFEKISADKELIYVFMIYDNESETALSELLREVSFNKVVFADTAGLARDAVKKSQTERAALEKQREAVFEEIKNYIGYKDLMEALSDYVSAERDKTAAQGKMIGTNRVVALSGWAPAESVDRLKKALSKVSKNICLEDRPPDKDEPFPVLMRNRGVARPIELITELYSTPDSASVDPTTIMTPFFLFFFGMMVSDAAYGVILSIVTFVLLRKMKPTGTMEKILRMLFYGGICVVFWGILFGSWFGGINDFFHNDTLGRLTAPLWFNPLDDPMKLLIVAFILGGVHLFTGMGIEIYKLCKRGRVLDALFDQVSWMVLMVGLVLFGAVPAASRVGLYMAIVGAAVLVLTQGRAEKGIFKKLFGGVSSLYTITSYLSDVLSYSRLLALGLATGVIATVINTMGMLVGGFGIIGSIGLIIIFLGGHVFNLLINVLGGYVHSSRLQYVEFFGKFFEGGGQAFVPLRRKFKFIFLKEGADEL